MADNKIEWTFPAKEITFMKLEIWTVTIIALLIFVFATSQFRQVFYAILFTVLFLGLYILIAYLIQRVRAVEETYHLNPNYLQIIRSTRNKEKKTVVPLKSIKAHKLDRFFLGGYLLTDEKKHLLFFNTKQELLHFEEKLKKYLSGNVLKKKRK